MIVRVKKDVRQSDEEEIDRGRWKTGSTTLEMKDKEGSSREGAFKLKA